MPILMLSTVGTSLLTNGAPRDEAKLLSDHANASDANMPPEAQALVQSRAEQARVKLADSAAAKAASAELNGILTFYEQAGSKPDSRDIHILVATDTAQGRQTAALLESYLRGFGIADVRTLHPAGLSTRDTRAFSDGMRHLLRDIETLAPAEYRARGFRVIFNLVGGFKSLQGYLNTVAMFHADEIIYIFEGEGSRLLRIPRLPVRLDDTILRAHAPELALLEASDVLNVAGPVASPSLRSLPELMLYEENGHAMLSEWGLLAWQQVKPMLAEALLPFPMLQYSDRFRREFTQWPDAKDRIRLQERLARVSLLLSHSNGDTAPLKRDSALQYDNYSGSASAVGHFRASAAGAGSLRVSCDSLPSGLGLLLRRFGAHDDINRSP